MRNLFAFPQWLALLFPFGLAVTLIPSTAAASFTITTVSLPNGVDGVAFSDQLASANGTGTVTWKLSAGSSLVTGLHLSATGLVSGTATASTNGAGSFKVVATDSATPTAHSATATIVYSMNPENGNFRIVTTQFPNATVGTTYASSIQSSAPATDTVTFELVNGTALPPGLKLSAAGAITGKPTTAGTTGFVVQATDATAQKSVIAYLAILVNYPPLQISGNVPAGTEGVPYGATFKGVGGNGGYTWIVNTTAVPTNGTQVALSDNLNAFQCSGNNLCVGGSPTSAGTVSFKVSVKDSAGAIAGPAAYSILINSASSGGQVSGQIANLNNWCGNGTVPSYPPITVTLGTTPARAATADAHSGQFSFSGVPAGTYTITPSISIAGSSSVFYPASEKVTVSGGSVTAPSFSFSVGYTVSGSAAYAGSDTGRIYLTLNNNQCGTTPGISIPAKGKFSIRGVPPGTYTLTAWMDDLGFGQPNATNPSGSRAVTVTTTANLTGANVTLTNPASFALPTAPQLQGVSGFDRGVLVQFNPIQNNNNVELPSSYKLEWSQTKNFTAVTGSKTFPATGVNGSGIWLVNDIANGAPWYFRVAGIAGASTSPWSNAWGPVVIGTPTAGNPISGTVTFNGTATGPLYTGFYNQSTGDVYVATYPHPVSPQIYSVKVPSGSGYVHFGIVDQYNSGVVVPGDIQNTNDNGNKSTVTITGSTANDDLTLPSADTIVRQNTAHYNQVNQYGTANGFSLNFSLKVGIKLPVAVTVLSGPNILYPVDLGVCPECAGSGFNFTISLDSATPKVGDTYSLLVTFSDGTTATLPAVVSGVPDFFATNLAPTGNGSNTKPTFTWTNPANASSYTYEFQLWDANGNEIWSIPGNNSKSNGFSSSVTSIKWGTDPTSSNNPPSVPSLTAGEIYSWQISVQDSNNNTTQQQVIYKP
jgi:hypothetical protein